jgi:hypothetical protein
VPLIGTLDSQRTQQFMERLLERIVETNSPVALVDIMGVPTIDTQTAQHSGSKPHHRRAPAGRPVVLTGVRPPSRRPWSISAWIFRYHHPFFLAVRLWRWTCSSCRSPRPPIIAEETLMAIGTISVIKIRDILLVTKAA